MAATKLSLSFDEELARDTRAVAQQEGRSLSSLVAELTAEGLRRRALRDAIAAYEDEHGVISDAEMASVRAQVRTTHHGRQH